MELANGILHGQLLVSNVLKVTLGVAKYASEDVLAPIDVISCVHEVSANLDIQIYILNSLIVNTGFIG